jgi:hypothetical protein
MKRVIWHRVAQKTKTEFISMEDPVVCAVRSITWQPIAPKRRGKYMPKTAMGRDWTISLIF